MSLIALVSMSFKSGPVKHKRTLLNGQVVTTIEAEFTLNENNVGYYTLSGTEKKVPIIIHLLTEETPYQVIDLKTGMDITERLIMVCKCEFCGNEFGDFASSYSIPCIMCQCGEALEHPFMYNTPCGCCCNIEFLD